LPSQLGLVQGLKPWFGALMFTGMAFLFSGIAVALTVIIRTLQMQEKVLRNFGHGPASPLFLPRSLLLLEGPGVIVTGPPP
jgi:hypothetical protein